MSEYSIVPSSGAYGEGWEDQFVIPQGRNHTMSVGGTSGNEGFTQQTFLGASIRSFSCNAGFGDTTSSLSVELVNDEFFPNDHTGLGQGNDPYHDGTRDTFAPPVAGAPVFFKFGARGATTEAAWRQTFDDTYGYSTNSSTNHQFVFGGILQAFTQNRGPGGNPLYSVSVQDPREILSNATIILKNYAGTTYNNKNLFNVFGFLEYDPSDSLAASLQSDSSDKSVLKKLVDTNGNIRYVGETNGGSISTFGVDVYKFGNSAFNITNYPSTFPITGQGFARQSDQGIPLYRVNQALNALLEYDGALPAEYKANGFGGVIDFRGYKYVVDFSGFPFSKIPSMYFLDYEQMDILSYVQELADIISHDLFVSLLPVIDHPACSWLYNKNQHTIENGPYSDIIAGIIRIDVIDRSVQPSYGSIKTYLDNLASRGIHVENQDVGYELSNVTTDKFVVGGQEVEMYYFNNNKDRDNLELRKLENGEANQYALLQKDQWSLNTMLQQQILPFYGFLGKDAVTIPRGFGAYQQIMLDSSSLDAHGVGNYYIATEMELRAASVSYEKWRNFLLLYNETYIQELGENQVILSNLASSTTDPLANLSDSEQSTLAAENLAGRDFGVSVPRCVFNSDKDYMGDDGYPASPCSPPYGYPLYYKRAEKIGIPEAGLVAVATSYTSVITNAERIEDTAQAADNFLRINKKSLTEQIGNKPNPNNSEAISRAQEAAYTHIKTIEDFIANSPSQIAALRNFSERPDQKRLQKLLPGIAREYIKNARKVYDFVKNVADTYLGKQFLVRIPKACNVNYNASISVDGSDNNVMNIVGGPFGFKPMPVNTGISYAGSAEFTNVLSQISRQDNGQDPYESYLSIAKTSSNQTSYSYGALKNNFNPISEKWEFNYEPDPQGGFFNYALYNRNLSLIESIALPDSSLPPASRQSLTPRDLTNFVSENGRISCYVRYNHSQFLDFQGVSKDSISQQVLTDEGFVPDIMEQLNNLNPDKSASLDEIGRRLDGSKTEKAVAFVKCSVEPRFYMPPRVVEKSTKVWARQYEFVPNFSSLDLVEKKDSNGCISYVPAQPYALPIFKVPHDTTGGLTAGGSDGTHVNNQDFVRRTDPDLKADIVETQNANLDSRFVYAVIKVPGKVMPSVDSRYLDGPYKAFNAPKLYNLLTADVVKNVAGFESPAMITNDDKPIVGLDKLTTKNFTDAASAQRNTLNGLAMDLPEGALSFTAPSPVYPDIVVLPLRSNERCYGPWLSSFVPNYSGDTRVRYSNIGGKVEFIKDESLVPWNYAGYQLMNEAGSLRAQFSNSLLLFSERGGFVIPEAPTGISLAKTLLDGGPLVTSISVNIDQKISTTVKMDLYTSRFGKLQKQKEGAIAKIARERQKMIDMSNELTRKGFLANSKSNLLTDSSAAEGLVKRSEGHLSSLQRGQTVYNNLVISAKRTTKTLKNLEGGSISVDEVAYGSSLQSPGYMEEALSESNNPDIDYQGLAGGALPFEGYSQTPGDTAYFPAVNYNHTRAMQERIFGINFDDYTPET